MTSTFFFLLYISSQNSVNDINVNFVQIYLSLTNDREYFC